MFHDTGFAIDDYKQCISLTYSGVFRQCLWLQGGDAINFANNIQDEFRKKFNNRTFSDK